MKAKSLTSIIIIALFANGCSIYPGITSTSQKTDVDWDRAITDPMIENKTLLEEDIQPVSDPLVEAVYGLETEISTFVYKSKQNTIDPIVEKFRPQFDSLLTMVLSYKKVPVEVWDALLRLGILFRYDANEAILANMEIAYEEDVFTENTKSYPIVNGYLGRLFPGWPSVEIADRIITGFKIHSDNEDNLSRYTFHLIKQVRNEFPDFKFQFFGADNMYTFLYAAEYTITKQTAGQSNYPEPIDLSINQNDRKKWIRNHIVKYKKLISGGGTS